MKIETMAKEDSTYACCGICVEDIEVDERYVGGLQCECEQNFYICMKCARKLARLIRKEEKSV